MKRYPINPLVVTPLIAALCLLLVACAAPPVQGTSTREIIDATLDESSRTSPPVAPPADISAALLPAIGPSAASAGAPSEPRFDVAVNKAPAHEFFMGLVEGTPYNMVVHPLVAGDISLNLKNVTIPEVMDAVRDVYGYDFQRSTTGYQVLPAALQSRIFKVDYLTILRSGSSQTNVSSGQLSGGGGGTTGGTTTGGTTGTGTTGGSSGSQVSTRSLSDFWTELEEALKSLVGTEGGRSVVVNPQSGVVVARALPSELRSIDEFLKATQNSIQRQVIIEARILEVELRDGFQSGINWSLLGRPGDGKTITAGQIGGSVFSATGVASASPFSVATGVFSLALALSDFSAFIELLKSQGEVHVLSSPRVSTVNNQKAIIRVGSDEFFVTSSSAVTTTTTGTTTTTPSLTLTPFFSGIALDVTPQISENGEIILHIHPIVSEVRDQTKTISVGGISQTLPLALSSVRESDSIVRAADGQLIVLGGLMQDSTRRDSAGVPGLSDVPGVGGLFNQRRNSARKSELVILLRPTIVDDQQQWTQTLRKTAESFKSLRPAAAK